jgi:hypothetical protein
LGSRRDAHVLGACDRPQVKIPSSGFAGDSDRRQRGRGSGGSAGEGRASVPSADGGQGEHAGAMHGVDRRIGACHSGAGPVERGCPLNKQASPQQAHHSRWRWRAASAYRAGDRTWPDQEHAADDAPECRHRGRRPTGCSRAAARGGMHQPSTGHHRCRRHSTVPTAAAAPVMAASVPWCCEAQSCGS